jgi:glycosyltransferase involved in cell wall biosynthesis
MIRTLAEAGHRIDIVAACVEFPEHPNVRVLEGGGSSPLSKHRIRLAALRASGRQTYDCMHAVDDAVVFVSKVVRFRKSKLIYDASRCFTGSVGTAPSGLWKLLPRYFQQLEKKILSQAAAVLVPCSVLKGDLQNLERNAAIVQIEDVPAQSLFAGYQVERATLLERFEGVSSSWVVCSILPGSGKEQRNLLVAARKVIETVPNAAFFFKGSLVEEAEKLAANLDIRGRCSFLAADETAEFLAALDMADAAMLMPYSASRYIHHEVFTLLHSPAPLVAIQCTAYEKILTNQNSIQVLPSSESIAEGLLRALREPLFSLGIALEGQQLVAGNFTFSSFKHKLRMAYHEALKKK